MEFQGGKTKTGRVEQLTQNSTPQQLFELGVDVPSEKWVFQLGWVLKCSKWVGISSKLGWGEKRGNAS